MKKAGFVLLEVLIATAIGAVLMGLMLTSMYQSMRYETSINAITSVYMRAMLFNQQMEHDISGAFVPYQALDVVRTTTQPTQDKTSSQKKLENVFLATVQGDNITELTFISYNPMQEYWSSETGRAQPRIVRIVYKLIPDPDHKDSFILTRQEGNALDLKEYAQAPRAYPLIEGIKSFKGTFSYTKSEKKETKNASKEASAKPEIISMPSWVPDSKKQDKDMPQLPHTVKIDLVLWTKAYTQEEEFTFIFSIVEPSLTQQTSPVPPAQQESVGAQQPEQANRPSPQQPTGSGSQQVSFNRQPNTARFQGGTGSRSTNVNRNHPATSRQS